MIPIVQPTPVRRDPHYRCDRQYTVTRQPDGTYVAVVHHLGGRERREMTDLEEAVAWIRGAAVWLAGEEIGREDIRYFEIVPVTKMESQERPLPRLERVE